MKAHTRIISLTVCLLILAAILGLQPGQAKAAASQLHFRLDAAGATMPNQEGDSPGSQVQPTPSATAYPGPIEDGPAGPYDSTPGAYPAAPPTPIVFPTDSYPAGSEAGHAVNGTPIPNIGSQDAGPPTVEPSEIQDTKPEPILGTIFLWLGFGAAFAVFISSIVAAIYYYDRRRATSN